MPKVLWGKYVRKTRLVPAAAVVGRARRGIPVANPDKPTEYQALIRQCRPKQAAPKSVEQQLDALLSLHQKRRAQQEQPEVDAKQSALERLRVQMRDELMPVFDNLKAKYAEAGIFIEMDARDFLSGGVGLLVEVEYDVYGMQMEGTVRPQGIAFQEARYCNNIRGVVRAGPMLRTRNLTGQQFREFLCERISQLVRSAMRSQQARPPAGGQG